ncbi:photosynthetic complex putative assembly protein PuhB [Methylobacterium sp. Leaf118]|uniref:photosynthetic complex putative assembly protein PuhB n=1 Tax=Methylobacterium sp. Leaf118 TaxID=2876562 RepID=UPI001E3882DF|nr:photosynthetic complex putative assembly protein PuhB [Methylobacterium sp. Leaf118]
MSESDFLPEGTLRGLPGPLPKGERILWRGAPGVRGVLLRAFHARLVMAWFGGVAVLITIAAASAGTPAAALAAAGPTLLIGLGAVGLLAFFSWLVQRTTVYTVTNRRVVLHIGIALPITLNLPHEQIEAAGLHLFADGSGDIPLRLPPGERVAYLHLWPHARPWQVSRPEPMLRSVPDAAAVAALLSQALAERVGGRGEATLPAVAATRPEPRPGRLAAAGSH